jgi:hypothetical protein
MLTRAFLFFYQYGIFLEVFHKFYSYLFYFFVYLFERLFIEIKEFLKKVWKIIKIKSVRYCKNKTLRQFHLIKPTQGFSLL